MRRLHQLALCERRRTSQRSSAVPFSIDAPFLDQTAHDAERVVNGTLAFVKNELVAAHRENTDGASPIFDARDLDNLRPVIICLFHEIRVSELVLRECLDVRDGFASKTLCEEIDLITFHVFDDEDVEALQEGKGCVIDCIAQDGFLDE